MTEGALDKAAVILRGIPGVTDVARLSASHIQKVVELESTQERGLSLPCRNVGIALMAEREACFVILKTSAFRPSIVPTLYLVEEGGRPGSDHALTVAGKQYTVVGEEVTGDIARYTEPVMRLAGSFVMFPGRRRSPIVPCFFLLPPLPFPELGQVSGALGLREVMSVSPSLVSDAYLREQLGFPPSNNSATLLVGFDSTLP